MYCNRAVTMCKFESRHVVSSVVVIIIIIVYSSKILTNSTKHKITLYNNEPQPFVYFNSFSNER